MCDSNMHTVVFSPQLTENDFCNYYQLKPKFVFIAGMKAATQEGPQLTCTFSGGWFEVGTTHK